ncbi:MAG TPA: SdpI family protein [Mucilaginibacter sp.]|nr:SdpI family protein [Mucilaginibacter sp.]
MKKFNYIDIAAMLIWLLPAMYLWVVYSSLPATVPLHYGIDGKVNRYGNKSELISMTALLLSINLLVYLLMKFLPSIDPKRQVKYGEETFRKIAFGIVFFISALNIAILFTTAHRGMPATKLILPIAGILFAFIGNLMNNIKPNYFAGVRTPWTLENEDNWRATHRLAGRLWFIGGIAVTIITLLLPSSLATIAFTCGVAALSFTPVIYSYVYFKKHQPVNNP